MEGGREAAGGGGLPQAQEPDMNPVLPCELKASEHQQSELFHLLRAFTRNLTPKIMTHLN